jgi:gliding motility-associated-like protein
MALKSQKGYVNYFMFYMGTTLLCLISFITFSQNVVNNGNNIVVNPGAYFVITGDYINRNSNGNGQVDIDGTMLIDGNWINNASNTVFTNIETIPDGKVVLRGASPQFIGGTNNTIFENLVLLRSRKTLKVTDCHVTGIMTLDAILDLNSNKIILDNNTPSAINYLSKYILSETTPAQGYGEVQWNIGNNKNTYSIPFGSGLSNTNDLNLVLSTTTAGNPSTGSLTFATYPSDCSNNPLPTGVVSLDHDPLNVADRYWIIRPDYNINKPTVDITFKYLFEDVDICNQNIVQENLQAMRYNTSSLTWDDMTPGGTANKNARTVTITGVSPNDLYEPWTLVDYDQPPIDIYFPNAFTPDGDGLNDYFGPVGLDLDKYTFTMYIFDRWGEMIFEADNANQMWNGRPTGSDKIAQIGVYTWLAILVDQLGQEKRYIGRVTLLR